MCKILSNLLKTKVVWPVVKKENMFGLKNSIDTTKNHCFYGPIVQRTKTAE